MRIVARLAAIDAYRFVLVQKRPALLHVALQTWFFVAQRLIGHTRPGSHAPGGSRSPVWIVAIRAGHEPFVHPVLERHRELRAHFAVASVTKCGLLLGQKKFRNGRLVDRMAARADHLVQGVLRAPDIGPAQRLGVASQAVVQNALGLELGEGDDCRLSAARLDVCFAWPMTTFAPGPLWSFLARSNALIVRILVERRRYVGMTRPADVAPDVA